jgi:hypothetical protein
MVCLIFKKVKPWEDQPVRMRNHMTDADMNINLEVFGEQTKTETMQKTN